MCGVRLLPVQEPFCKEALLNEESCVIRMEQAGYQHYQVITDNTTVMTMTVAHYFLCTPPGTVLAQGDTKLHCRRSAAAGGGAQHRKAARFTGQVQAGAVGLGEEEGGRGGGGETDPPRGLGKAGDRASRRTGIHMADKGRKGISRTEK